MTSLGSIGTYENVLWHSIGSLGDLSHSCHGWWIVLGGWGTSWWCGIMTLEPGVPLARESLLIVTEHLRIITEIGGACVVAGPSAGVG